MSGGDGSASGVLIGRARRVWVAHNYRTESLYGFYYRVRHFYRGYLDSHHEDIRDDFLLIVEGAHERVHLHSTSTGPRYAASRPEYKETYVNTTAAIQSSSRQARPFSPCGELRQHKGVGGKL